MKKVFQLFPCLKRLLINLPEQSNFSKTTISAFIKVADNKYYAQLQGYFDIPSIYGATLLVLLKNPNKHFLPQ